MALKATLAKAAYDKLTDEVKEHYAVNDDGKTYRLDVDGMDDPAELKRGKDRANEDLKVAKKRIRDLEKEVGEKDETDDAKSKDIAVLTKAAETKYAKDVGERDERIGKLTAGMAKRALETAALALATEVSKAPALMLPHVRDRLVIDWVDEEPVVKVKGDDGKPSSTSFDALKKNLRDDKSFSDIIIVSKASGGGGAAHKDPSTNGGAGFQNSTDQSKPADFSRLNPNDLASRIKARKDAEAQG